MRTAIFDTTIQGAAVALFHSYGVALAPSNSTPAYLTNVVLEEPTADVAFESPALRGTLTLAVPSHVFGQLAGDEWRAAGAHDGTLELANQLMGRVKNRLGQFQVALKTGLPALASQEALDRRRARQDLVRLFPFRALRGEVLVVIEGAIDDGRLAFSAAAPVRREGEIILF